MLVCLSKILKDLCNAGIYHPDLNMNNILINRNGEKVYLVDFDKAVVKKQIREQDKMKMVSKLYRSCKKLRLHQRGLTTTDLIRFLRLYVGEDRARIKKYIKKAMVDLRWHRILWKKR
jgi:predicted Ser/Thr protein kinase